MDRYKGSNGSMCKLSIILTAAIVAVSGMAFTKAVKESKKNLQTFYYSGSGNVDAPSSYQTSLPEDVSCGGTSSTICSIEAQANGTGDKPVFDAGYPSSNPGHYSATYREEQ